MSYPHALLIAIYPTCLQTRTYHVLEVRSQESHCHWNVSQGNQPYIAFTRLKRLILTITIALTPNPNLNHNPIPNPSISITLTLRSHNFYLIRTLTITLALIYVSFYSNHNPILIQSLIQPLLLPSPHRSPHPISHSPTSHSIPIPHPHISLPVTQLQSH